LGAAYPLIIEAVSHFKARSCLIDGEAVTCDENGLAVFERLRHQREGRNVFLYAFDLLELDGTDLRREPFETRKATLASPATREPFRPAPQRAPQPPRRRCVSPRLQDGADTVCASTARRRVRRHEVVEGKLSRVAHDVKHGAKGPIESDAIALVFELRNVTLQSRLEAGVPQD